MIIDSHCHLDDPKLFNQIDDVINRANEKAVKKLLTICTTLESFKKIVFIINKYKNIYGTFGIHPHESKNFPNVDKNFILESKKNNKKIIGIGETGLDFYYNYSEKEVQKKSFIEHINAAAELNIPIIVHSRAAENDTYEILKSENKNSNLKIPENLDAINVGLPPRNFDCDISTNLSMILSKVNNKSPLELAKNLIILIQKL